MSGVSAPIRILVGIVFGLMLPVVLSGAARTQAPVVERIDVLSAGIYELTILDRRGTDDGAHEVRNTIGTYRLLAQTDRVRLRRCVSFGYEYRVIGTPKDVSIPLRLVTRVPPPGLLNPHTGRITREIETLLLRTIGRRHVRAYTLEHEWELMPGVWTLEIWEGPRRLAAQSFTLHGSCHGDCRRKDDHDQCTKAVVSQLQQTDVPRAPTR